LPIAADLSISANQEHDAASKTATLSTMSAALQIIVPFTATAIVREHGAEVQSANIRMTSTSTTI